MYSAYYINKQGILCYAGNPTMGPNLKEHFKEGYRWCFYEGKYGYNPCPTYTEYEVWSISKYGLIHGFRDIDPNFLSKHGLYHIQLGYTHRILTL